MTYAPKNIVERATSQYRPTTIVQRYDEQETVRTVTLRLIVESEVK